MRDLAMINRLAGFTLLGSLAIVAAGGSRDVRAQPAAPVSPDLFSGLTWRCIGPFDGGPVASVTGVAAEPGVYVITTPSGGAWKTIDGGDMWTPIGREASAAPAPDPHRWVDPANARRIVRTATQGIEVSLDGGQTWMASHHLPIAEVARLVPRAKSAEAAGRRSVAGTRARVSISDPARPGLVFAGTNDAVYVSFNDGAEWQSLRLNMPPVAINDLDIRGNDLVAATEGRSVWQLDDISPLRQLGTSGAPGALAGGGQAAAILFKPADVVLADLGQMEYLDFCLGASTRGDVTLEIADASGRVVHAATTVPPEPADRWLPVMPPLPSTPGHHRVIWDLRLDPPPAPKNQFAQYARSAFEELPPDPDGPRVLAGTYRVTLTAGGRSYSQPLVVRPDPRATPATLADGRREFDLAVTIYDAMQVAHTAFMQLARVRSELRPMLASTDPQIQASAADLDARLVQLDGSDWTGLVIPDADDENGEVDEKEGKHPDFVPPKPVSVSKDYDDPTTILGRVFGNVNHAPAFTTLSADLGGMLTKAMTDAGQTDYDRTCRQLSGVLDAWRAINADDLARVNAEFAARKLPRLSIATSVPALICR